MNCYICRQSISQRDIRFSRQGDTTKLSQTVFHSECLTNSVLFRVADLSSSKLETISKQHDIPSMALVQRHVPLTDRLQFLFGHDHIDHFWKANDDLQEDIQAHTSLGKRSDYTTLNPTERGFRLNVFQLVNQLYGLKHPWLNSFYKLSTQNISSPRTPKRLFFAGESKVF